MSTEHDLEVTQGMPFGAARTAAAEALVRRIDAEGPADLLPRAMVTLYNSYHMTGLDKQAIVALARLLRLWDTTPERFSGRDEHLTFWAFKEMASALCDYPEISTAQAEAMLDDMERRFALRHRGNSAVLHARFRWAWGSGIGNAEAARRKWISLPADEVGDCRACVIGTQVAFLLDQQRNQEALEIGRTQTGQCRTEPTRTLHAMALAAFNLGQYEESAEYFRRAVVSEETVKSITSATEGHYLELLGRAGHLEALLRSIRRDGRDSLLNPVNPLRHLRYLLGLLAGLSAHRSEFDRPTGVVLPNAPAAGQEASVGELHAWVTAAATALAQAYDARSGTTYYADRVAAAAAATAEVTAVDFVDRGDASKHSSAAGDSELLAGASTPGGAPHAVRAAEAAGGADGEALLAAAEAHADAGDYREAEDAFAAAAHTFESGGWLGKAGHALAEAAQCAATVHAEERAHGLFQRAIPLMRAGETEQNIVAAVLAAWQPVAALVGDLEPAVTTCAETLDTHEDFDPAGMSPELAERRAETWAVTRAGLRETLARAIAAGRGRVFGPDRGPERAAAEAQLAGEELGTLGMLGRASKAFMLAGELCRDLGRSEAAIWAFESAFEGFTAAGYSEERIDAADELLLMLRETGQPERAEALVAKLW